MQTPTYGSTAPQIQSAAANSSLNVQMYGLTVGTITQMSKVNASPGEAPVAIPEGLLRSCDWSRSLRAD
jgi:hypothetical protein